MKIIKYIILILGLTILIPGAAIALTDKEKVNMFVGEIKVIENVDVNRVAIGRGSLVKVKSLPNSQLLIIAESPGSTSIHLWYKDGREQDLSIRILEKDPERRVRLEDMIKMDVKIIEFRKSALKSLGINWQSSIAGPGGAFARDWSANDYFRGEPGSEIFQDLPNRVSPAASYFGIATSITSRINFMASNGDAFTLAEPNLSCINGGTAKFLAGGEIPIPIRGANGEITVTYKDYGIVLEITPIAGPDGVIAAKLMTEVSQLDPSVKVLDVPGFLTRRTATQMNVRNNETIVISGMLNSENSKDVDKIPLLGDIPIIGHLFKSTNFRDAQTELAIFVTPHIVSAKSESNVNRLENLRNRKEKRMKIIEDKLDLGLVD
jgi:pilus assembly protein CpaC